MTRPHPHWFWSALLLVLLGLLATQWLSSDGDLKRFDWSPPQAIAPRLGDLPILQPVEMGASTLLAVSERPLFSPSRRPPPKMEAKTVEAIPDQLDAVRLMGVYGGKENGGVVYQLDGRTQRAKVGQDVAGWQIRSIGTNMAELARDGATRELTVTRKTATLPADAVGQAAPAAGAIAPSEEAHRKKEQGELRERVRGMNARRAAIGLPPLPEP